MFPIAFKNYCKKNSEDYWEILLFHSYYQGSIKDWISFSERNSTRTIGWVCCMWLCSRAYIRGIKTWRERASFLSIQRMWFCSLWTPQAKKMYKKRLWSNPKPNDGETASFHYHAMFLPYWGMTWTALMMEYLEAKKEI